MGKLWREADRCSFVLESECVVGRRATCNLRLLEAHVSSQHALIRWRSGGWELKDRSHNGTFVNGVRLKYDEAYVLQPGDAVGFGHPDGSWIVTDTDEPRAMVVAVATQEAVLAEDGIIGLPASDNPSFTIYRHPDGLWKLDSAHGPLIVLENGTIFHAAGEQWRFSCPESVAVTVTNRFGLEQAAPLLHFFVSKDEEYVELHLEY